MEYLTALTMAEQWDTYEEALEAGIQKALKTSGGITMPTSEVYNIDRMDFLKKFPDNFFDLIIDDPPYGIGEDGSKNKSEDVMLDLEKENNIVNQKTINHIAREILSHHQKNILKNLFEFLKIKSFGAQIIL